MSGISLGFYAEHIQPDQYVEGNPNADILY